MKENMAMSELCTSHSTLFSKGSRIWGEHIPDPKLTKREFLKFCGASFCVLSASQLFGFPETLRAQTAQKGLIKTKLSPYFTSLSGGEIQCELCLSGAMFPRGKEVFAECERTGMGSIIAWFMGTLAQFIWTPLRRSLFSMYFLPLPLSR